MSRILFDDSRFPLVETTWPDGPVSDEALEEWLARSRASWDRGRHVVLHVGMRATGMTSVQRSRLGEFTKENERRLAKVVIATAIVASSPIVRGMITAINWFAPPAFPQRVFGAKDEAEEWLMEHLHADLASGR